MTDLFFRGLPNNLVSENFMITLSLALMTPWVMKSDRKAQYWQMDYLVNKSYNRE